MEDEKDKCHSLENLAASLRTELEECKLKIAYLEKECEESSEVIRDLELKFRAMQVSIDRLSIFFFPFIRIKESFINIRYHEFFFELFNIFFLVAYT